MCMAPHRRRRQRAACRTARLAVAVQSKFQCDAVHLRRPVAFVSRRVFLILLFFFGVWCV